MGRGSGPGTGMGAMCQPNQHRRVKVIVTCTLRCLPRLTCLAVRDDDLDAAPSGASLFGLALAADDEDTCDALRLQVGRNGA